MFNLKVIAPLAVGAVLIGLAANAGGYTQNRIDGQRPDAPELAAYGPHEIGVRQIELMNPGQIDILSIDPAADKPATLPTYDRGLTVEVWYPAATGVLGVTAMKAFIRDGKTEVDLHGKAVRDATPADGTYPLILVSHGYPGNRFLMSHLAENLASKGYVVASIDHRDSTYRDKFAFGSTLVNRSLDQTFVLNEMARLSGEDGSFLNGLVDTDTTGLIGYSLGGYGAVITAGGGVTQAAVDYAWGGPHGTLGVHLSGSDSHNALPDPRIKTAIAFAPWGLTYGFWSADTLKGVQIPMMFIAGSVDDVSGYEPGVKSIFQGAVNVDRALLTFENANHNAGAPMPPPAEGREVDADLGFAPYDHYADAVWENVRMNNIAQHFSTAWMDQHLKGDADKGAYLDLVPNANDSIWAVNEDGTHKEEHTHWMGFQNRTAKGLRYEVPESW